MSRIKADLSLVSLNQLCTLTGRNFRTLKKVLAEVKPHDDGSGTLLYRPPEVLPIIYGEDLVTQRLGALEPPDPDRAPKYNPAQEKARLDRIRADKVELEVEVMRKNLVPREKVEASWGQLLGNFRQKILNLPAKLSPKICAVKSVKEVQRILTEECHEALKELSEYDDGINRSRAQSQGI